MTESPLVSIVIPTRNRGDLLRQAIGSCALQTWTNREIIVVDDGSKEDIAAVVDALRIRFKLGSALKYIRQEPLNANVARNNGIADASGEFVQLMDSDDLLHPDKLKVQIDQLLQAPHLDMVYCQDELFRETPGDLRLLWNVRILWPGRDDLDRFLYEDAVWHTGSPLWRKTALNRIGKWHEDLLVWQDWEFAIKAFGARIKYESTDMVLQYIRQHKGIRSMTAHSLLPLEQSRVKAGKLAYDYLREADLLDFGRKLLLMEYFQKRVDGASEIGDKGARRLRKETLLFMKGFALTPKQKFALSTLYFLNDTPLFSYLYTCYRKRYSSFHPPKLRDIVGTIGGTPPSSEFWNQIA